MDINKALTYVTQDERWITKLLIGAVMILLSIFIVPLFILNGYMIQIVRNVMDGLEKPLPEWDDWGKLLRDGFYYFVAQLVYTLPIWLLMCCSMAFFLPAAFSEGEMANVLASIGVFAWIVMSCLVILFAVAYMVIGPAIAIQYAREDSLSATLRYQEVLAMTRDNISDIIIALLVTIGIGLVVSLIAVVPLIGWVISFAASVYIVFVTGHLYGQIGAKIGGAPKEKAFNDTI